MTIDAVSDWSATAASNTDVGGNNIDEGCAPAGINNAIRELMAQVATARADGSTLSISDLSAETAAVSGDLFTFADVSASNALKKITYTNLVATLATSLTTSLAGLLCPVGMVAPYGGTSAPTGWLLCYGQAVSRTTYSALFTAISTTYGVGDGSTTFNLPDLRGRVVAGQDDMGGTSANRLTDFSGGLDGDTLGDTGGSEKHTLTTAQLPSHDHLGGVGDDGSVAFVYDSSTTGMPGNALSSVATQLTDSTHQGKTSTTGSGTAHNNVQPTIILNYIIFANV